MTLRELNEHFALVQRREKAKSMLFRLRDLAAGAISEPPGVRERIGDLDNETAYLSASVERLSKQIEDNEAAILAFIDGIPDIQAQTILRLRFLRGLAWCEVAAICGRENTEART